MSFRVSEASSGWWCPGLPSCRLLGCIGVRRGRERRQGVVAVGQRGRDLVEHAGRDRLARLGRRLDSAANKSGTWLQPVASNSGNCCFDTLVSELFTRRRSATAATIAMASMDG